MCEHTYSNDLRVEIRIAHLHFICLLCHGFHVARHNISELNKLGFS